MMTASNNQTGSAISGKLLRIRWDDKNYDLRYTNAAMRNAEDVYDDIYHAETCDWTRILNDIAKGKLKGVMAVYFGALKTVLPRLTWQEFDDKFRLDMIEEVRNMMLSAVSNAMPEAAPGDGKNV